MAIQKTTVNIPSELWSAFKARCAVLGVTMTQRLTTLIQRDVEPADAAGVA